MAAIAIHAKDENHRNEPGVFARMFARAYVIVNPSRVKLVSKEALDEAIDDARLNAIADERAGGPFVKVNLSDL